MLERLRVLPAERGGRPIQVGDLGLMVTTLGETGRGVPPLARLVYYVTGNHDHEPSYRGVTRPTEMAPNLVFVPAGTVLELDGRRIAFLGGGDSVIDRHVRRDGVDWWPEERVTMADVARLRAGGRVDLLVCHTPPAFVYHYFGFSPDPSALAVGQAWQLLGRPAGDLRPSAQVAGGRPRPESWGSLRSWSPS